LKNISIKRVASGIPNSVGGVDLLIRWGYFNESKVIKYIYFTVTPYNAVRDKQKSKIGNTDNITVEITGPINSNYDFTSIY